MIELKQSFSVHECLEILSKPYDSNIDYCQIFLLVSNKINENDSKQEIIGGEKNDNL